MELILPAEVPAAVVLLLFPEGLNLLLQLVNLLVFGLGGLAHRLVKVDLKVKSQSTMVNRICTFIFSQ